MDASKLVQLYISKGYRIEPNGDVYRPNGTLADRVTIQAFAAIDKATQVSHDLSRRAIRSHARTRGTP